METAERCEDLVAAPDQDVHKSIRASTMNGLVICLIGVVFGGRCDCRHSASSRKNTGSCRLCRCFLLNPMNVCPNNYVGGALSSKIANLLAQ